MDKILKDSDARETWGLFKTYLAPYWRRLIMTALGSAVLGILMSIRPLMLTPAFEAFLETPETPAEKPGDLTLSNIGTTILSILDVGSDDVMAIGITVAFLYFVATSIVAALDMGLHVVTIRTRAAIQRDMLVALHHHLMTLPLKVFQRSRAGDLASRVTEDTRRTAKSIDSAGRGLIQASVQIFSTLALLLYTNVWLTLVVLILGASHLAVNRVLGAGIRRRSRAYGTQLGLLTSTLLESLLNVRLIKSFAAEEYDHQRLSEEADRAAHRSAKMTIGQYYEFPLRLLIDAILIGLLLVLVFLAVNNKLLTIPAAAMFVYLAKQLNDPFVALFGNFLALHDIRGSAARIIEVFSMKNTMEDGLRHLPDSQSSVALKNVSFEYEPGRRVLQKVDLTIERGQTVAIVGPSGSGKTTLVDLVMRLYDVTEGVVEFGGVDVREYRQREYRQQFGVVAQECLLFNGTVRENIIFNRTADEGKLAHAVWSSNAEEFLARLPAGLDTEIGDRGIRLSGGQRQRVALARAVYDYPRLLVLDEATSALDARSERAVQVAMQRVSKDITTVIIAHRLSTITHADKIVVLKEGRIEAEGDHRTLLSTNSLYRSLCALSPDVVDTPLSHAR